MRGSPLVRALVVLVGLLALLLPLRTLTSHQTVRQPSTDTQIAAAKKLHLVLTSTSAPFRYEVSFAGKVIWHGDSTTNSAESDVDLDFPAEGIDLVLDASWSETKPTAVRLQVTPPDGVPIAKMVWGDGTKASGVLTFTEGN
jgi:Tfp pilus assembly protein PilV